MVLSVSVAEIKALSSVEQVNAVASVLLTRLFWALRIANPDEISEAVERVVQQPGRFDLDTILPVVRDRVVRDRRRDERSSGRDDMHPASGIVVDAVERIGDRRRVVLDRTLATGPPATGLPASIRTPSRPENEISPRVDDRGPFLARPEPAG